VTLKFLVLYQLDPHIFGVKSVVNVNWCQTQLFHVVNPYMLYYHSLL